MERKAKSAILEALRHATVDEAQAVEFLEISALPEARLAQVREWAETFINGEADSVLAILNAQQ